MDGYSAAERQVSDFGDVLLSEGIFVRFVVNEV